MSNGHKTDIHEVIYIYIYKTKSFETSTIFHVSTVLKKNNKTKKNKTKTKEKKRHKPDTTQLPSLLTLSLSRILCHYLPPSSSSTSST